MFITAKIAFVSKSGWGTSNCQDGCTGWGGSIIKLAKTVKLYQLQNLSKLVEQVKMVRPPWTLQLDKVYK